MVAGEIKPDVVFENEQLLAFRDINPQAPVHILVIPKKHVATLNELSTEDAGLAGELLMAVNAIAEQEGFAKAGYRTIINCNQDGGQDIYHIHLHILAGRQLSWPPG
jgi:histidine triad (HIT) family protein